MADSQLRIKLFGLPVDGGMVLADVFASKLRTAINSLRTADRLINARKCYDFLIADLKADSAEVVLRERPSGPHADRYSAVLFMAETFDHVCRESVRPGKVPVELVKEAA